MFLETKDLRTHLREEYQELISRGDDTVVTAAIDGAVAEMRGYLGRYDTERIFGAEGAQRHSLLLIFAKDIAVWHLINMTQPGVHYELREGRYNRAVAWLKSVQSGDVTPDLPEARDEEGNPEGALVYHSSNPKRTQHF